MAPWIAALVVGSVLIVPPALAGTSKSVGTAVGVHRTGTTTLKNAASKPAPNADPDYDIRPDEETGAVNKQIPHSAYSAARISADHVPAPSAKAIVAATTWGFNGISHRQQRLLAGGNQFSIEPPDQALCVGNGYVVEGVNLAMAVYDTAGNQLASDTLNHFYGLPYAIQRTNPPVFGPFTSDPKCLYDSTTGRFFMTILEADTNSATGGFTGRTSVMIAVSDGSDPTGTWTIYSLDTTNDGNNGTPSHDGCPCLGDQPLIGADANAFFVTTNEFSLFDDAFNGAQVYALSKADLADGVAPAGVMIDVGAMPTPDLGGIWYTLQPATTPYGAAFDETAGGTEYLMSSLEFSGGLDNRVAVWAISNTSSIDSGEPDLRLDHRVIGSPIYGLAPKAEQADGPRPLAAALGTPMEKLELLDTNDDRMQQVVYVDGHLYGSMSSPVKQKNGPTKAGFAWLIVNAGVNGDGDVSASTWRSGYVSVEGASVMYPSIAVNASGAGIIAFSISSLGMYPSVGYVPVSSGGSVGNVRISANGRAPEDGFSGYVAFGGGREPRTSRWGDYSAAVSDEAGNIWYAAEFIPGGLRTVNANWGTFVGAVTP